MKNLRSFKKAIRNVSVVSFDIFDTLLYRSVAQPSDLFRIMERQGESVPLGFSRQRVEAERIAVKNKKGPVSLTEIYEILKTVYGECAENILSLEVQEELDGCRPNMDCVRLLEDCVEAGKQVVLISDMYLSEKEITKMLDKCGIHGYQKIFISCESGASKVKGTLYDKVLSELQISPHKMLHVGDNPKGDIRIPFSKGIHVWPVFGREKVKDQNLESRTLNKCVKDTIQGMNEYERLGCETMGPLLIGFSQWLLERLRSKSIHDVYFFSREGYMLKKAFDMVAPQEFTTHYLYCSRRSYTVPLLWKHPSFEDVLDHITFANGQKALRRFLLRIGLDPEKYTKIATQYGLDLDDYFEFDTLKCSERVRKFYEEKLKASVEALSKQEFEALSNYIKSCNMDERIAVVDIGYHGTMQYALEELICELGLDIDVKGFYLGLSVDHSPLITKNMIQAEGYLYGPGKNEYLVDRFSCFTSIYESIFLAQHGSVHRFIMKNGVAEPEFYPYEYTVQNGKVVDEEVIISAYQDGAMSLVCYMCNSFSHRLFPISPELAARHLVKMGTQPTLHQARLWGDFRIFDQLIMTVARPQPIWKYILYPRQFIEDIMKSVWRIGFMRRCFILPLPYEYFYEKLSSLYKRKIIR